MHETSVFEKEKEKMVTTEAIPYGFCQCGCGGLAPIAKQSTSRLGYVKGQPMRFILGHHSKVIWTPELFWSKVEKTETCWLWTGQLDISGYGIDYCNGELRKAHRVAYELLVGPIQEGLQLDHLCRVRRCVRPINPSHLEPVTCQVNVLRGEGIAANLARQTHCHRGHELDGLNNRGQRFCKTCAKAADLRQREKSLLNRQLAL